MHASGLRRAPAAVTTALAAAAALTGVAWAAALTGVAAAAEPSVRLTVAFERDGAARQVAHLRCAGTRARADGFLRRVGAARACRHARRIAAFLDRRPARRACTQIYGGSERARVRGRIGTRRIDRRLDRTDGCRISDYDRAVPLVPRPSRLGP
jgi:hypothetical protein